jgi:ADP-L-glycero-D-manno-heptose 6-epimerase
MKKTGKKRVLVTGGSGFIGWNLIKNLCDYDVFYTGRLDENFTEATYLGYEFSNLDLTNVKPDFLLHCAAITDTLVQDRELMIKVNCNDSFDLFMKAFDAGCQKVIYASSCAVYGDTSAPFREEGPFKPLNVYGESKLMLDERCSKISHPIVGLRYSNVYGFGERHKRHAKSMICQIINLIKDGKSPTLFKWGEQRRDFVYVQDVVQANLLAFDCKHSGVYNVGSGASTSFNEIVSIVNSVCKTNFVPNYIDNHISSSYQNLTQCSLEKIKAHIGYTPKWDINSGIKDYLRYIL